MGEQLRQAEASGVSEGLEQQQLLYLDVLVAADVPDMHAPIAAAHRQIVAVITDCCRKECSMASLQLHTAQSQWRQNAPQVESREPPACNARQ